MEIFLLANDIKALQQPCFVYRSYWLFIGCRSNHIFTPLAVRDKPAITYILAISMRRVKHRDSVESVKLGIQRSLVQDSPKALCYVLEQDSSCSA